MCREGESGLECCHMSCKWVDPGKIHVQFTPWPLIQRSWLAWPKFIHFFDKKMHCRPIYIRSIQFVLLGCRANVPFLSYYSTRMQGHRVRWRPLKWGTSWIEVNLISCTINTTDWEDAARNRPRWWRQCTEGTKLPETRSNVILEERHRKRPNIVVSVQDYCAHPGSTFTNSHWETPTRP